MHYDDYISALRQTFVYSSGFQGLAVATRLLCLKRPDYFVCIDGKNKRGLARALGLAANKIRIDTYWDAVVEPILESPWYRSRRPVNPTEQSAWDARVAMIDALFYQPSAVADELPEYRDQNEPQSGWRDLLDVVNCGKTMDEIEAGAYMCPNAGKAYKHKQARFLGSYQSKMVRSVHEIDALVACSPGGTEFDLRWKNNDESDLSLLARAQAILERINVDWHSKPLRDSGLQIFLLGAGAETQFIKDSRGGLQGSHLYFRNIAKTLEAETAMALAEKLRGRRWSEFGH